MKQEEVVFFNNIGRAFDDLGNKAKARENFDKAYALADNNLAKASILLSIGKSDFDSGDKQKALESFDKSLKLFKEIGDKFGESRAIISIARVYSEQGDKQKAAEYYNLALRVQRMFGFQIGEGNTLGNLMSVWQSLGNRRLAIFYGKQAVNVFQRIRSDVQKVDESAQRSFIKSVEDTYRKLAVILLEEGQVLEAQQILALLKAEEFYQFTQRSSDSVPTLPRQLELNDSETVVAEKYKELTEKFIEPTKHLSELEFAKRKQSLTPEQQAELQNLQTKLDELDKQFKEFLQGLSDRFSPPKTANNLESAKSTTEIWKKKFAEFGKGTVLLTTLLTPNHYYVIITTANSQIVRTKEISQTDFNAKFDTLFRVLRNPATNPLKATQDLYQILVKPIEADLQQLNAQTLLWSLDGKLRYIPIAVLHDGQNFMLEKYTNAVITLNQPPTNERSAPDTWRALGAGVSNGFKDDLPDLPQVPKELETIIQDETVKKTTSEEGFFTGKILLNENFSPSSFVDALRQKPQLVHIATHFALNFDKDVDSYLLLGNNDELVLAELRKEARFDLDGVELLTLSACETSREAKDSNGVEIESLGVIAQKRGAKAVLVSLWSISDNSTVELMKEFYQQYKKGKGIVSKAEALRQAQTTLLKKSPSVYSHPAYWGAFIIIGNYNI